MKFGEKLIQAGLIVQAQLDSALNHQKQTKQLLGEALLELGYIGEESLLKFLAKEFNTRYVSTERLSKAKINHELFKIIPHDLAEERLLFPIILDKTAERIGIVSCEPQQEAAIQEVRIISGMKQVDIYVAQRSTIQALIKKHYRGDIHAFDLLGGEPPKEFDDLMSEITEQFSENAPVFLEPEPKSVSSGPVITPSPEPITLPEKSLSWTQALEDVRGQSLVSNNDFLETLNILIGLLELTLPSRQGHSARVARLVKSVSEYLGLSERETNYNITAAYLHELGKRSEPHLTLLSIAFSPEYRGLASRYHLTPCRLFDRVHLPLEVNKILSHLYENFDGSGIPEGLIGNEIPLGSRIVSIVDAYEDLTNNLQNIFGSTLKTQSALERIKKNKNILFDSSLFEALEKQLGADTSLSAIEQGKPTAIAADSVEPAFNQQQPLPALSDRSKPTPRLANVSAEENGLLSSNEQSPTTPPGTFSEISETKGSILSGSLENKSALSLILVLANKKRTGTLSLRNQELKGVIVFEDGDVFQASFDILEGEEAFLELAAWKNCLYHFDPKQTSKHRIIKTSTAKLIQVASLSEE